MSDDLLQRLRAARGDIHAPAAMMAEGLLASLPEAERAPLRDAFDAAAVVHWFDAELLRRLLDLPAEAAEARLATLAGLSVVEPYHRVGGGRY